MSTLYCLRSVLVWCVIACYAKCQAIHRSQSRASATVLRRSPANQPRILIHLTSPSRDSAPSQRALSMATEAAKVELPPLVQMTSSGSATDAAPPHAAPTSNGADSLAQNSSHAAISSVTTQNETPRGAKRQKVTRACDSCKSRKRRCTGELPCSLCW